MDRHKRKRPYILMMQGLSESVKDSFKAACVRRGLSMTEAMEALMRLYAANPSCVRGYTRHELRLLKENPDAGPND